MKKLISVIVAATVVLLPFQAQLYASAVTFTAQGNVTLVSSFTAALKNVADDTANGTGFGFADGNALATSTQYVLVNYNDNSVGFQAITISTNNRVAAANPKYTGIAQGGGMVGTVNKDVTIPLLWTVFPAKVTGGYSFGTAIQTTREFFVTDKLQGTTAANQNPANGASACNDANKDGTCGAGEFNDRGNGTSGTSGNGTFDAKIWSTGLAANRCNATSDNFEGIDWDGDCYDGAKPFDAGYASMVFGIAGDDSSVADASGYTEATNTPGPTGRTDLDGSVFLYLGTDYTGAEAQLFKTNQLTVELVTIS